YAFKRYNGKLSVDLTRERKEKRKNRLDVAFQKWLAKKPSKSNPNHGDDGLLAARVRFLAANTKLDNSKNNVAIGLYFSNSALDTGAPHLKSMDKHLEFLINKYQNKMSSTLESRLRAISFNGSFEKRTFIRYNGKKLEQIV